MGVLQVRDGTSETDPLIGKYCGSTLPAPITSRSSSLWIRFKSDGSVTRAGFRAMYEVGEQLRTYNLELKFLKRILRTMDIVTIINVPFLQ